MNVTTICKWQHMLRSSGDTKLLRRVKEPQGNKYIDSIQPTRPTIQHHNVFVLDRCWTVELGEKLVANHCRRVTDESDATVHIMDTIMECVEPACRRVHWAAALTGAAVCMPDVYLKGKAGPWMQYCHALGVNRILWVSDSVQHASPRLWNLLQSLIDTDGSNWTGR